MSQGLAAQAGGSLLGGDPRRGPSANAILAAYGLGTQLGVLLPYGRTQESEADHIELILMARADYDPHEATAFWSRMERAAGGGGPPEFLSTHPGHGARARLRRAKFADAASRASSSARRACGVGVA